MALADQYVNDLMMQLQQPKQVEAQRLPSKDELIQMGKSGFLTHMGGKLPGFLKGMVTEAKEFAQKAFKGGENVVEVNNAQAGQVEPLDVDKASNALIGHESRGSSFPADTTVKSTGATGISQITPVMINQYNQLTGNSLTKDELLSDPNLQMEVTKTLVSDIMTRYEDGLDEDWPTHSKKLTAYKKEIKSKFNEPIYWLAGEWVAGPNWVAKLDSKTAPGAKETVRDYIQKVAQIYKGSDGLELSLQ